ncbi:hypothetical protein ID866_11978 [Astraeus odoratus]|nr:hypothetical protein ID866_11978 [Astraeus odoratus]
MLTEYTLSDHSILCFSTSQSHSLKNVVELLCCTQGKSKLLISLQDGGWILGPTGQLILWIPPIHSVLFAHVYNVLVIPGGRLELDLSKMAHGCNWYQCFISKHV